MNNTTSQPRGACSASSPQNYAGGKNSTYQHIINQIPPHRVYIEPFLGSGAIMRRKLPAQLNIGIDLDERVLPESIANLGDEIPRPSLNPTIAANIAENDDAEATPEMTRVSSIANNNDVVHTIKNDDGRSKNVYIHGNALDFLLDYRFAGDEFIYFDPPYLMSARKSQRNLYRYEFGSEQEHRALLTFICSLPCMVAISGYGSQLYTDMLSGWRSISFQAHTRQGMATEWLWMNYDEPIALHDYRYLGGNFRERERIKRKAKRWVNRFLSLAVLERRAIVFELRESGVIVSNDGTAVISKGSK